MTTPNPEVKEQQFVYHTDQQVSVNAFIDIDVEGEPVRFQVTSRYGSSPDKITKTTQAAIEAFKALRATYPRPVGKPNQPVSETGEKKAYEPKPVQHEGLPEGMEAFKEDFDEIEITPHADNKVTVAFYRDGLKFPVGAKMNKWKIENAQTSLAKLLEHVDLTKAAKMRVAGTQYYTNGNEYLDSNGNKKHYKDLRLIEARF